MFTPILIKFWVRSSNSLIIVEGLYSLEILSMKNGYFRLFFKLLFS